MFSLQRTVWPGLYTLRSRDYNFSELLNEPEIQVYALSVEKKTYEWNENKREEDVEKNKTFERCEEKKI